MGAQFFSVAMTAVEEEEDRARSLQTARTPPTQEISLTAVSKRLVKFCYTIFIMTTLYPNIHVRVYTFLSLFDDPLPINAIWHEIGIGQKSV